MGGTAQTRAGEQAPSCFCPCKTVKPPLPQGSLLRGGWALCAQHGSGECGQLGLQAWASPCPQPLAVPPSPLWPRSWPPAFLLGTEREASGPLQAGGGCGVWPVPWALGSWGQTLGPHSQLQGWMGPGHLLFNSPGSPGVAGGPQSALRNAGRALSLTWPQVGPGGCLWTRVPHTLKLFLSRQMAWQSSWNFSLRGLLPWPRARPTCSPADGGGLFLCQPPLPGSPPP